MHFRTAPAVAAMTVILTVAVQASAQQQRIYDRPTEGVLLPSPSLTETTQATSLSVNPANMALLDSWSFMYAGAWLQNQEHLAGQGHGLFFAFPIGPLAFGFSTEALTPPENVRDWQGLDDRIRFSIGAAFHVRRAIALGLVYRTFWYYDYGDINTFDIGLTVHPANQLALSFAVMDVNAPTVGYKRVGESGFLENEVKEAPRRFNVGLTLRPLGNDRLALGGELLYIYGKGDNDIRRTDVTALITAMIFDGLTMRVRFGAEGIRDDDYENGYFLDGSLSLDLPSFGVGVSSFAQLHPDDKRDYQGTAWEVRFSGDEAPSLNFPRSIRPARVVVVKLDEHLDSYKLADLVQLLGRMERDSGLDIAVLRPAIGSMSLTDAQEIRRRILGLKAAGRQVVCYLDEAGGPEYLACAAATQVWINPAGGVRLAGVSTRLVHFRDLLDKIGVKADIVRIGEYKSSPDALTQSEPSQESADQVNRYLDVAYENLLSNLKADRGLADRKAAIDLVDQGPFTANEAAARGLVDKLVTREAFEKDLEDFAGGSLFIDKRYAETALRHRRYIDAPTVAVVHIDGEIIDGKSVDVPLFNIKMTGSETAVEMLRQVREDPHIRAVVLRIDSPGGSAMASDVIWNEIMALREQKPVIASLGSMATSGAYYIASAAEEIYAERSTMTGSIGIFYGKADLSGLLNKAGINTVDFKRGKNADSESWTRPYTNEERERLTRQIGEYYELFKERVVEGRSNGLDGKILERLARGRIWSGEDAKYHLLVDHIGGYAEALKRAEELGSVEPDTKIYHFPKPRIGLIQRLASNVREFMKEPSALDALVLSSGMKRTIGAVIPIAASDPNAPQARLPFAVVEP